MSFKKIRWFNFRVNRWNDNQLAVIRGCDSFSDVRCFISSIVTDNSVNVREDEYGSFIIEPKLREAIVIFDGKKFYSVAM